jgi:hypothetical protein
MAKGNAVCVALQALWAATPAFSATKVVDGPQATYEAAAEWLFVGFDGADGSDPKSVGIQVEQDWMSFSKTLYEPAGAVTCALTVTGGDADLLTARARVYTLLTAASDALRTDPTLGGLVMKSHISGHVYHPQISSAGSKARVVFAVNYEAQL